MFPGSVFVLTGGFLFGPVFGFIYALIGATLGACSAFLVSRYVASEWVEKNVKGYIGKVKKGIDDEGWKFVAMMRLLPFIPYNVLNYACGLTKIPLIPYAVTSSICISPILFAYVYVGSVGREVMNGTTDVKSLVTKVSMALGLLIFMVFLLPKFFSKKK